MDGDGTWERYASPGAGTVVGDLRVRRAVGSPQLGRAVDVLVWLPPGHAADPSRRFPVLYLWDGQNLFDDATSNVGEWQVDETLTTLARDGIEWIAVGLAHGGDDRADEYAPWRGSHGYGGRGDESLAFLVETVKPLVDRSFPTRTAAADTALAGSSLGGLMALYGLFRHPATFRRAGVLSPAFMFTEGRIFEWLADRDPPDGCRVWMDVGTAEAPEDPELQRAYVEEFERMTALLRAKGLGPDRLRTLLDEGGIHRESAWARRLPEALRFLLADQRTVPG